MTADIDTENKIIFLGQMSERTLLEDTQEWYQQEILIQHGKIPILNLKLFHALKLRFTDSKSKKF